MQDANFEKPGVRDGLDCVDITIFFFSYTIKAAKATLV